MKLLWVALSISAAIIAQQPVPGPIVGGGSGGGGSSASALPAVTTATGAAGQTIAVSAVGFYRNNTSGAITYTLPTIVLDAVGSQYCFRNAATRTGAITLQLPASTTADVNGAAGTAAGTLVSAGALGDSVCVSAVSVTEYEAYVGAGIWTNN